MPKDDPGLRIEQIDAEMVELQKEIDAIKDDTDKGSAESRASLNERMQQLKAEKNKLLKDMDAADGSDG